MRTPPTRRSCARGLTKHYRHPWTLKLTPGLTRLEPRGRGAARCSATWARTGPGKTTTIKLLTGLLQSDVGRGVGCSASRSAAKRAGARIGFLPEQPYFYDSLTGTRVPRVRRRSCPGLGGREASTRARHWLGRVGLGERPRLALRKYSKGMLQRIGLAAALIHDPELVILDEPMSGLDPFGRRDVRELILEQRERGVTVLFSSHILPDVEMLCDRVGVVLGGAARAHRHGRTSSSRRSSNASRSAAWVRRSSRCRRGGAGGSSAIELPEGTTFVLAGRARGERRARVAARRTARRCAPSRRSARVARGLLPVGRGIRGMTSPGSRRTA